MNTQASDVMYDRRAKTIIPAVYAVVTLIILYFALAGHGDLNRGVTPFFTDLTAFTAYVRGGFDAAEIDRTPDPSKGVWQVFPNSGDAGETSLRIRNSGLPDIPERRFLSPFADEAREYTILIPVETSAAKLAFLYAKASRVPGVSLARLGENWEIYLNGRLLRSEMHLDDAGQIRLHRTLRDIFFPIDKDLFKEGTNVFAFRIVGDPTYDSTGFYYRSQYFLESYEEIEKMHGDVLILVLSGIYFFLGLHQLMFFFASKRNFSNFFYFVFTVCMSVYLLARSRYVYAFIPDSNIAFRVEYASLLLTMTFVGIFLESIATRRKPGRFSIVYCVFFAALLFSMIVFSQQYADNALLIGLLGILVYMTYLMLFVASRAFLKEQRRLWNLAAEAGIRRSFPVDCLRALIDTPRGNTLLAFFYMSACSVFDVIDVAFIHMNFGLVRYGFFAFAAIGTFILTDRFRLLLTRLDMSNTALDEMNSTLEAAVHARTRELEIQARIAEEASESAQMASKAKSEFLAHMSHEIRTPMNAILGMLELVLQKELPSDAREDMLLIRRSGANLLSIINDILDFSKIESGKLEIVSDRYELASLLNDAVSIIRIRLIENPLCFVANVNAKLPSALIGDEARMRQILLNLLTNALKYTREGYFSLTVDGVRTDDGNLLLTFEVADTGIGIKEEELDRIFGDFTRLDASKNRRTEGTGLGLAITRSICAAMNGEISVRSAYGEGSVFTVKVPQAVEDPRALASVASPWTKRALLYDHRPFYAESIMRSLESLDVWCTLASGREELLQAIRTGPYSHVFVSEALFDEVLQTLEERGDAHPVPVLLADSGEIGLRDDVKLLETPAHVVSIANLLNDVETHRRHPENEGVSGGFYPRFAAPEARVLVVDDIGTNLKVIKGLLSPYEIETDVCLSGREAVALARTNRYDLVFMDHMMPDMDGVETTAAIRDIDKDDPYYRDLPIVALTANAVVGQREIFLRSGMNDFLAKPIELQKLGAMLKKWIPTGKQTERASFETEDGGGSESLIIPGVSVEKGLLNLGGSIAMYTDILEDFCKDAEERMERIEESAHAEDLTLYMTLVHALKGAAGSIGAQTFADVAAAMEESARTGDRAAIRARNGELLAILRALVDDIRSALARRAPAEADAGLPAEALAAKLRALRAALSDMDIGSVNELLLAYADLSTGAKNEMRLAEIERMILMFEYDEAIEAIDAIDALLSR
jgi:signal transduction histidine kinase/CheY-like chemotaxis protein